MSFYIEGFFLFGDFFLTEEATSGRLQLQNGELNFLQNNIYVV